MTIKMTTKFAIASHVEEDKKATFYSDLSEIKRYGDEGIEVIIFKMFTNHYGLIHKCREGPWSVLAHNGCYCGIRPSKEILATIDLLNS